MKDIHQFEPIWENWVIDERIDGGSFGDVWKAHREDEFSKVRQYAAVKHISIPRTDNSYEDDIGFPNEESRRQYYRTLIERLITEIDAMVSLRGKPNIVSYEEHKVVPKQNRCGYDLFLRMELLTSLPRHIERLKRPLTENEVIKLGIDIATALEILQSKKYVHRDIKPANIFIDGQGDYKLGDFGTARTLEATGNASTKAGTPNYMAPEVYSLSKHYDQTVDIYSLGIVLYRYLNGGYLPFLSPENMESDVALDRRIRGEKLPPPSQASEQLANIILKACAYDPKDRYQTAVEFKKDLIAVSQIKPKQKEIEVSVVCITEDGSEVYREKTSIQTNSKSMISVPKSCIQNGFEVVGKSTIEITVDINGIANPEEAKFVLRDNRTIFSTDVAVICLDENNNEILSQRRECFYQNRNLVKAPLIDGYKTDGYTEIEVEVLNNRTTNPPQVVFKYKKDPIATPEPEIKLPAVCVVPVVCVLEDGKEILNSKRTCREDTINIVTAPEITGYMLISESSKKISINQKGEAEPDKVVFTYRRLASEKKETSISIICKNDNGKELKRESVVAKAGKALNLAAPAIQGYKLIDENRKKVKLIVDDHGVPEQEEVLFIYKQEKEKGQKKRKITIIGVIAIVLWITTWIVISNVQKETKEYTITWQDDEGQTIDTTSVAYGTQPSHKEPVKEADQQYAYTFTGWQPEVKKVTEDAIYKATFKKEPLDVSNSNWICSNCGEENPDTNSFCTNCASPRADSEQASAMSHSDNEAAYTWTCSNCKAENSFDDIFCTNCAQTRLCLECGNSIPKDDKYCSNCATEAGKWKCTQCGELSGKDDQICANCGEERHKPGAQ